MFSLNNIYLYETAI